MLVFGRPYFSLRLALTKIMLFELGWSHRNSSWPCDHGTPQHMGLSENSVPLNPMVNDSSLSLLNGYNWGIPYFQTNPYCKTSIESFLCLRSLNGWWLWGMAFTERWRNFWPTRSKGCPFRFQVGFQVGLFRGGARPECNYMLCKRILPCYYLQKSTRCTKKIKKKQIQTIRILSSASFSAFFF